MILEGIFKLRYNIRGIFKIFHIIVIKSDKIRMLGQKLKKRTKRKKIHSWRQKDQNHGISRLRLVDC